MTDELEAIVRFVDDRAKIVRRPDDLRRARDEHARAAEGNLAYQRSADGILRRASPALRRVRVDWRSSRHGKIRSMRAWRFATRNFVRGLRAGRLTVLMIALTVAVAAITSIGFFIDRVRASVAQEAAGMIAADLRLSGSDPLNADYLAEAERRGPQDRAVHVVSDGRRRGRREPAREPLCRERRVSAARPSAALRRRRLGEQLYGDQRAARGPRLARGRAARAPRHRRRRRGHDRRARVRRRARARAPARPVARLRYVCAVADDESRRPRVDGAHPARQPRDLCAALRRRRGRRRGVSRMVRHVERRGPAPADGRPLRGTHRPSDRARRAVLEPGVHDRAAARGDGRCGLRAPLCGATSRGRRAAEVPRRFAGARARGHLARARDHRCCDRHRRQRARLRRAVWAWERSSRTSWSSSCRRRAWRPASAASSSRSRCSPGSRCPRC